MTLQLPQSFLNSINNFGSYPENLIHRTSYHSVLRAFKEQLDDKHKTPFARKDADVNVPFRDLLDDGSGTRRPRSLTFSMLIEHRIRET